jgi:L-amino acid N-acyltransferase YncA
MPRTQLAPSAQVAPSSRLDPRAQVAGRAALASPFTIRAAGPQDCAAIADFIGGLSPRTRFLRFFASVGPSSSLLRGLCGAGGRAYVLVATDRGGAIVGHAMAVDATAADGARTTDVGLVVADRWQRRGVGSALLAALIAGAAARGVGALIMDVLPENASMLAIIGRHWPEARRRSGPDFITFRADLRGQVSGSGAVLSGGARAGARAAA